MGRLIQVIDAQKEISEVKPNKVTFTPIALLGCLPFKTEYSDLVYNNSEGSLSYDDRYMSKIPLFNGCDFRVQAQSHLKWLNDYSPLDQDNYSIALASANSLIRSNWLNSDCFFQKSVNNRVSRMREFKTLFNKYDVLNSSALIAHRKMFRYILDACYKRSIRFDQEFNSYIPMQSFKIPYKDETYYIGQLREDLAKSGPYTGSIGSDLVDSQTLERIYRQVMYHQVPKEASFFSNKRYIFAHMTHSPLEIAFAFYLAYKLNWIVSLDEIGADYLDLDALRGTDEYNNEKEKLFCCITNSYNDLLDIALGFKGSVTSNVLTDFSKSVVIGNVKTPAEFRLMSIFSQLGFACFDISGLTFFECCCLNDYTAVTRINNNQDASLVAKFNPKAKLKDRDGEWYKLFFSLTFGTSIRTRQALPIVVDQAIKDRLNSKSCVWVNCDQTEVTPPLFPNMLLEQIIFGYNPSNLIKAINAFKEY